MTEALVLLISHEDELHPNRVLAYFESHGIRTDIRRPFKGEELGNPDGSVIASVVFGGPFSVFDEDQHPFLRDEHLWIERCLKLEIPLLGICQGAQSIARVLGAEVGPKPSGACEFGYYSITPTAAGQTYFPDQLFVAQAHYHEFAVPHGAELLASGCEFQNQAFRYGENAFAFQFHAELFPAGFRRWQTELSSLYDKPGAQAPPRQQELMDLHDPAQHRWFMRFQEELFGAAVRAVRDRAPELAHHA